MNPLSKSFRLLGGVFVISILAGTSLVQAQDTKPTTAPPAAPATTPAAAPSAPASNPSVMLLKEGHTDSIRAKAAEDLGKQGDVSAIPALTDALGDPSAKVRRAVVAALAQFHQSTALPPLEQAATKDGDDSVRILAVQCLVGYYTGNLPSSGVTGFVKRNWQRAATHFQPDDTRIAPGIAVDPSVIAALVTALKDVRSNDASREAAKGLGILVAKPAVLDLVAAAHSSDIDLSRESLNALAKIKDLDSGTKLVDLLDSPNRDVKRDTCVTVGILRVKEALPKLQSIYEGSVDPKDKSAAMQGLAFLGDKSSVPVFAKALASDDKNVRQGAAEGLARAADPQSMDALQKALSTEKDASPRLAMNYALAALGNNDAFNELVNELGGRMRGDVARAYLTELCRDPALLPKLYIHFQNPDAGIRKRLCVVLMYSGDQSSLEQLDRLSHDPDKDVAATAMQAKRAVRARLDAAGAPGKS